MFEKWPMRLSFPFWHELPAGTKWSEVVVKFGGLCPFLVEHWRVLFSQVPLEHRGPLAQWNPLVARGHEQWQVAIANHNP